MGWLLPKFAYDIINDEMFYHYAYDSYGDGQTGYSGILFFVMICPNPDNRWFF